MIECCKNIWSFRMKCIFSLFFILVYLNSNPLDGLLTIFQGDSEKVYEIKEISMIDEDKEFIEEKWDKLSKNTKKTEEILIKLNNAPESAFFSSDKKSFRKDLDKQLAKILYMITEDKAAINFIDDIRKLEDDLHEEKSKLSQFSENLLITGGGQSKIDKINKKINNLESEILAKKESLRYNLHSGGVDLSLEELNVLIKRVDVYDIAHLTLVYNNFKVVVEKLGKLMELNGGDEKLTRKYYSMYVVLSEVLVYAQKEYVKKMDNEYLPKIAEIVIKAQNIQEETKQLMLKAKSINANNKKVLDYNYKSQVQTAEIAFSYGEQLFKQRNEIKNNLEKSSLNLQIALNTFETVEISHSLLDFMKENSQAFNSLLTIELPELIPFENEAIALEYEKITKEILG